MFLNFARSRESDMETSVAALGRIIGAIGESDFGARTTAAFCAFTGFDLAALILHRGPRSADLLFDNFDRVGGRSGVETYVRAKHRVHPMNAEASAPRAPHARHFASRGAAPPAGSLGGPPPAETATHHTLGWPRGLEE